MAERGEEDNVDELVRTLASVYCYQKSIRCSETELQTAKYTVARSKYVSDVCFAVEI